MDHTLNLNDINRSYVDNKGFFHVICSCDRHFTGPTVEDVTGQWEEHVREEALKRG